MRLDPCLGRLVGRDDLLHRLKGLLAEDDQGTGPRLLVLSGLGGVGKTSLAVEYGHRRLEDGWLVWQFPADSAAAMTASFGNLAAQLGIRDLFDSSDPVTRVHGLLASYPGNWLLVFDNAPDPSSLQAFLPPAGSGQVIVTSQNASWPRQVSLEVPALEAEAAAGFLLARGARADPGGHDDEEAARDLAESLGGLPLALEQACAYMQAADLAIPEYLELFRVRKAALLDKAGTADHPGNVATTFSLAFGQLEQTAPDAVALLCLISHCSPGAVPLPLLLPRPGPPASPGSGLPEVLIPLLNDPVRVLDAVAALRRYSLARPLAGRSVSVHRLVRAILVSRLVPDERESWRHAVAVLVETALPAHPEDPRSWPVFGSLLPHGLAVLPRGSAAMARIASYLGHSGFFAAASNLSLQVLRYRADALGAAHVATLAARADYARWTGAGGQAGVARDQYAEILRIHQENGAQDQAAILRIRGDLARWTGEAGDPAAARDQLAALLPALEAASGPLHSDTLTARANLARWTGESGERRAARDQLAALLPVRQQVSGEDHPDTLATRANLARWTGEAGNPAAARDQLAALLPLRERVSGKTHPDSLGARQQLASWTGEAGDVAGAIEQYEALLPVMEQVLGVGHPRSLTVRHNLASWIADAGDAAAARDAYADLLPIRERILGPAHPDTLDTYHQLAQYTGITGDAASAREQFAALVIRREQTFGSEHPSTLIARINLARWTGADGDPADARDQLARLQPVLERVLGAEHPYTLSALEHRARSTGEAGDLEQAMERLAALLRIRERVSGPDHPGTRSVRDALAVLTQARRQGTRSS